jgi:hypothetical protein
VGFRSLAGEAEAKIILLALPVEFGHIFFSILLSENDPMFMLVMVYFRTVFTLLLKSLSSFSLNVHRQSLRRLEWRGLTLAFLIGCEVQSLE